MGSEASFLEWNKDNIFISLIQAEGHLRNLEAGFGSRGEFLSCATKHLAYAEGEAEEAVSHSLAVEGPERSQEYAKMMNSIRELRKRIQAGAVGAEEGIREVRRIRHSFERLNPPFDTAKCRSCGSPEEALRKLSDLKDLEQEMARHVLEDLSAKYGVEPPELEISDKCHEPNMGYYIDGGKITMCRGGVNLHVLLHEFKHYYDHKTGKPLDEHEAEDFAIETVEKGLYSPEAKHNHQSDVKMDSAKDIALVVGGVNLGWGIGYAAKTYIDPLAPGVVLGQDPSLPIDLVGTGLGIGVAMWKKRSDLVRKLAGLIAAGLSVHLWEDLMKILATVPPAAVSPGAVVAAAIPGIPAMPTPAPRMAGYPFGSPVSVGGTMSPPQYMLDTVPGAPRTVALSPKYLLSS